MAPLESEHGVNYSVCSASDSDEMARLLAEVFAERDPPAAAVGLTPSEFEAFVRLYCPRAAAGGLTIIARSVETGEMMGALLAEDSASEPPPGLVLLSPKFCPIFDILGQLDAAYRGGRAAIAGEQLHLLLLGVARNFAGRGVAHRLVAQCVANGLRKGYRKAVTEATNGTSQHIFRKQGFVERVRLSYRDHRFNGQDVFAAIAEHGGPILMDRPMARRAAPLRTG